MRSAGLVLAAQLANFPDIRTVVVDRKDAWSRSARPTAWTCRAVEMIDFDLANR